MMIVGLSSLSHHKNSHVTSFQLKCQNISSVKWKILAFVPEWTEKILSPMHVIILSLIYKVCSQCSMLTPTIGLK